MHSSSTGPSDSERSSGLPCMRWPLQGLRWLWVVLLSVPPPLESSRGGVRSSVGGSGSSGRPRWSRVGSAVAYTPAEVRALTPVRESVEKRALLPDLRDVFLCHAWDDRRGPAKELHESARVTRCFGLVQREGRRPRLAIAARNRQGTGEVTSRDRACDPRAAAPPTRRGNRRQRAIGTPSTRPARSRRARHDI